MKEGKGHVNDFFREWKPLRYAEKINDYRCLPFRKRFDFGTGSW
jgi:hypothetical protein